MTTVTISLPESLKEFIDNQLATKAMGTSASISAHCCGGAGSGGRGAA